MVVSFRYLKHRRTLVGVSALALISAYLGFAALGAGAGTRADAAPSEPEVRRVKATTVEPRPIEENRRAVGEIRPRRESDLAFRVSGKVVSRAVDVGASVSKGQVLAHLDDEDYRNRLRSAKADQVAAEAVLVEAKGAESRIRRLLEKGYTTRANYDATLKNLRSAQAKLESANAAFDMAQDQLDYTELHADFDGIVTATAAENGQIVNVGQMVVRLAEPGARDAVFSIAEAAFSRAGSTNEKPRIVVSLLSNPAVTAVGIVREIAPIADAATRTYQVKVSLKDAPAEMRFGASVAGRLDNASAPVVVLPGSALFDKAGRPAVWVVDRQSQLALKPIIVARYETDRVIVGGGLAKGDIVVTAGVNRLRENQKVRVEKGDMQ